MQQRKVGDNGVVVGGIVNSNGAWADILLHSTALLVCSVATR